MSNITNIVFIDGIDMEMEAWELIRLFFDADSIKFVKSIDDVNCADKSSFIAVQAKETDEYFCVSTCYYPLIETYEHFSKAFLLQYETQYKSTKKVYHKELDMPGGKLLNSRKILAGACILEALSSYTRKKLPYGALTGVRPVKLAMLCINDGMNRTDSVNHLVKATGMSIEKANLLYDVAKLEHPFIHDNSNTIHLYIGIPYCPTRCLYCSFTSYPIRQYEKMVPLYMETLKKEINAVSEWILQYGFNIGSVYIGGGTPTSIDEVSFENLLHHINNSFDIKDIEFTVEAGRPDTITQKKLTIMKENSVSRISINPQTMNPETLKLIGRNHTSEDIQNKFYMARELGFDNINMDIIAGLPNENEEMFKYTLGKIKEMMPDGLTVHTMAIKRASRLKEEQKSFSATKDEAVEAMIEDAYKLAVEMGMSPYYLYRQKNILANLENTGYAKPGLECKYNIHTMEEKQTIIAMGAGSISKFVIPNEKRIERVFNIKEVPIYIERIDEMIEKKKRILHRFFNQVN